MKYKTLKCGIAKCYLLKSSEASVLIDTGVKLCRRSLLRQLNREFKKGAAPLKLIILTHAHNDHSGNAAFLCRRFGVPVGMTAADHDIINGDMTRRIKTHSLLGRTVRLLTRFFFGGRKIEPFTPDFFLNAGDVLSAEEYGTEMTIIALPGHSPGSIAVLAGDIVFAGDTALRVRRFFSHALYEDLEALKESGAKLSALPVKKACFGHGPDKKFKKIRI